MDRSFFARHPSLVAPELLGWLLTSHLVQPSLTLRLTEVEAYSGAGEDPASHAHRGPTPRTLPMFGPPGHWYVYLSYGMHLCVNVVAHEEGTAGGVLLRGALPLTPLPVLNASGPGRLGRALGLSLELSGTDALSGPLTLTPAPPPIEIRSTPRIGISKATDLPWRFLAL